MANTIPRNRRRSWSIAPPSPLVPPLFASRADLSRETRDLRARGSVTNYKKTRNRAYERTVSDDQSEGRGERERERWKVESSTGVDARSRGIDTILTSNLRSRLSFFGSGSSEIPSPRSSVDEGTRPGTRTRPENGLTGARDRRLGDDDVGERQTGLRGTKWRFSVVRWILRDKTYGFFFPPFRNCTFSVPTCPPTYLTIYLPTYIIPLLSKIRIYT